MQNVLSVVPAAVTPPPANVLNVDVLRRLRNINRAKRQLREMGFTVWGEMLESGSQRPKVEIKRCSVNQVRPLLHHSKGYTLKVVDGVRIGFTEFMNVTVMWEEV